MNPNVAIIAPGMMGAAVGKRLVDHGLKVLTSLQGRTEETRLRAQAAGMISGSDDGTVQVWHAAGTVCTYTGHSGGVRGVAWSPDGRCIASGSVDGTAHVWWAP